MKTTSENDVLKGRQKIYHIDRVVRETKKLFDDGTQIIYVNGSYKGKVGEPLDDLIHDFFCDNPADMRHKQLADRVKFLKDNEQGGSNMSSVIAEVFAEEIAESRKQGEKENLLNNIRNLMKKLQMTAQEAMDILDVPTDKQAEYRALI